MLLIFLQITPAFENALIAARLNEWFFFAVATPVCVMYAATWLKHGLIYGPLISFVLFLAFFIIGLNEYHVRTENIATTTEEIELLCSDTAEQFALLFLGIPLSMIETSITWCFAYFIVRMRQNIALKRGAAETNCVFCGRYISVSTAICPRCDTDQSIKNKQLYLDPNPYHPNNHA
jgi:hypothetical protein